MFYALEHLLTVMIRQGWFLQRPSVAALHWNVCTVARLGTGAMI